LKPPKCALCQVEHWPREPHRFASNAVVTQPDVVTPVVTVDNTVVTQGSRQVVWQQRNRERYNEKMRAWRAKKRAV
jgi:hypothetical protein